MRRLVRLAFALGLAACGARAPSPPTPDTRGCEPAVAEIVDEARAAVLAAPTDGRAWGELGLVCDAHGFTPEAAAAYTRASELDPSEVLWPYLAGMALSERDPIAALPFAECARVLAPDDAWVELRRGRILAQLGQRDLDKAAQARAALERALELDPENLEVRLSLAELLLESEPGAAPRARELLDAARAGAPDDRRVLVLLARALAASGDAAGAARIGDEALALPDSAPELDPHRAAVDERGRSALHVASRGQRRLRAGELELAIADLRTALAARPDLTPARIELGQALVLAGRADEGLSELRAVLERDPDNLAARRSLAAALAATGDLAASAAECRRVLDRVPGDRALLASYLDVLRRLGRTEEALAEERRLSSADDTDER